MDQKMRRFHPPAFNAKVVLEALQEQKILAELSSQFGIYAMVILKWKGQAEKILAERFSDKRQQ
jgi:transposase